MRRKFFRNAEWAVDAYGMKCLTCRYEIRAKTLGDVRRGTTLPDWPLHMASKGWVTMALFMEAFEHALVTHKDKYKQKFEPGWHEAVGEQIAKAEAWYAAYRRRHE